MTIVRKKEKLLQENMYPFFTIVSLCVFQNTTHIQCKYNICVIYSYIYGRLLYGYIRGYIDNDQ